MRAITSDRSPFRNSMENENIAELKQHIVVLLDNVDELNGGYAR
jgi:hypothetical protein